MKIIPLVLALVVGIEKDIRFTCLAGAVQEKLSDPEAICDTNPNSK